MKECASFMTFQININSQKHQLILAQFITVHLGFHSYTYEDLISPTACIRFIEFTQFLTWNPQTKLRKD